MFQWNRILYKISTISAITHGSPDPPQTLPTVAEIHRTFQQLPYLTFSKPSRGEASNSVRTAELQLMVIYEEAWSLPYILLFVVELRSTNKVFVVFLAMCL